MEEWIETWSAGKAVLQGMGLEITRDFLFFDLLDELCEGKEHYFIFAIGYVCYLLNTQTIDE